MSDNPFISPEDAGESELDSGSFIPILTGMLAGCGAFVIAIVLGFIGLIVYALWSKN